MSNADIKTLLIVFIFMPFLSLLVEYLGKIQGTWLRQENVSSDLDKVSRVGRYSLKQ